MVTTTATNFDTNLFAKKIRENAAESIFNEIHTKLKSNEGFALKIYSKELLELAKNIFLQQGYKFSCQNGQLIVTKP